MLWLALHFPAFPLEIFSRGAAAPEPLAVIEKQGNRTRVVACNEAASACGVQTGMPASAAQALATGLVIRTRDPVAEHESLCGIAAWAGRFTPSVSLQPPDGLLLEVGSCLRLHRGLDNLLGKVRSGLDEMGYASNIACTPTSHGAWLLALAGAEAIIREPARLEKILGALPVMLLNQPPETLDGLEMVGAHTLADCMRLPRAGMARRFGKGLLDELDRAFGRRPEAREFFEPPPNFARRLELPAQMNEAEGLLFAARRLLPELEGYLNLRQAGVQEFELICCHEDVADTIVKLGFVQPTRAVDRMLLLLRETLGRTRLPALVHTIMLNARIILPLEVSNTDLFQDNAEAGEGNLLLERLRIRLGKEAVFGITPAADHRPERAWRHCEAIHSDINLLRESASESRGARHPHVLPAHSGACAPGSSDVDPLATISAAMYKSPAIRQRPLWLLPKPLPCREDRFVLKSGPERIESGWWDGMDVERDYYVAQNHNGSRLWVYCEQGSGEWFVHGLFA